MTATKKIQFDASEYVISHGTNPRGRGSWAFSTTREMDYEPEQEKTYDEHKVVVGPSYIWVHRSTFTEAKRLAAFFAKDKNWPGLYVMP